MIIYQQHFDALTIERINSTVANTPELSRSALSRTVCEWLDWRSPNGQFKEVSCRKALLKLERCDLIQLPVAKATPNFSKQRNALSIFLPDFPEITCKLSEIGVIKITPITDKRSSSAKLWNAIMDKFHYLGKGPLCGAQIRYIVTSSIHGVIGGLSFSAAAWQLKARDLFIGWDRNTRSERLKKVVGNSRFLILPNIKVKNLASYILSQNVKRLSDDWQERYAYAPALLETFVDSRYYHGTCYKAANWLPVGMTSGRGRQDKNNKAALSTKYIYLYPLDKKWREILGGTPEPLEDPDKKAEPQDWIEKEFGNVELGDERLNTRLLKLARGFYAQPGASLPQACNGRAETKAAYRFLDNKRVNMDTLLEAHYKSTEQRIRKESVVLAVQDTSSLNFTTHKATKGLGLLSTKTGGGLGLQLHDTMAFSVEGTPLGLIDIQCWARDLEGKNKKQRAHRPIEEKESFKWLKSYHAAVELQKKCPDTTIISVGDRESDLYELFAETAKFKNGPKLLIRGEKTRMRHTSEGYLWDVMAEKKAAAIQHLQVPRSGKRPVREAQLTLRFAEVTLKPPLSKEHLPEIQAWAVYAREEKPPNDVENPLEWLIITTEPTKNIEKAIQILTWYAQRWGIEVYHRTLKSGCKIEERQFRDIDRIKSCLAIDLVIAWRIFFLTKIGREEPDRPCDFFLKKTNGKP